MTIIDGRVAATGTYVHKPTDRVASLLEPAMAFSSGARVCRLCQALTILPKTPLEAVERDSKES